MARDTSTTIVDPTSSSLVDQETLPISILTSLTKPAILFAIDPKLAGAEGIEPSVTVLETVGLPLTHAPSSLLFCQRLFYLLVRGMLAASVAEFLALQLIRVFLLVLHGRIVPVLTNRALVYEKL